MEIVILRQIKYAQTFLHHFICSVHFPTVQKHTGIETIPLFYWKNDKGVEPANGIQPSFCGDFSSPSFAVSRKVRRSFFAVSHLLVTFFLFLLLRTTLLYIISCRCGRSTSRLTWSWINLY